MINVSYGPDQISIYVHDAQRKYSADMAIRQGYKSSGIYLFN